MKLLTSGSTAKGAQEPNEEIFFPQFVPIPNPLQPNQINLHRLPGSGIPARDYFAAHALGLFALLQGGDDCDRVARLAYQVADAMIEARKPIAQAGGPSQFHEDYMRK
jgi:hypothetical protein